MVFGRRAILALDVSYDNVTDFDGILGGNNDIPRVNRGYPVYWEIKRRIFVTIIAPHHFLLWAPLLFGILVTPAKWHTPKTRKRDP